MNDPNAETAPIAVTPYPAIVELQETALRIVRAEFRQRLMRAAEQGDLDEAHRRLAAGRAGS